MTGTDIVPTHNELVPLEALPGVLEFAEKISRSGIVPGAFRGRPGDVAAAIVWGAEIGLGPMASLQYIDVIDGRASIRAEAKLALVRKAGHFISQDETPDDPDRCQVTGRRKDTGQEETVTYTKEEAEKAKLLQKANWQHHQKDMLWARVVTRICRHLFSDVFMGLAGNEDESEEIAAAELPPDQAPTAVREAPPLAGDDDIADAEIVDQAPSAGPEPIDSDQVLTGPISLDQIKHLNAAYRDVGVTDRADKHAYARRIIGHDFESSKDWTYAEAQKVIDTLERERAARLEATSLVTADHVDQLRAAMTEHLGAEDPEEGLWDRYLAAALDLGDQAPPAIDALTVAQQQQVLAAIAQERTEDGAGEATAASGETLFGDPFAD